MPANDLVLRAAKRQRTERTPVWLMRQAGRFDPMYRELRQRTNLTLEDTFRNADLAAEISLLPKRYGVDAIIFFQDILTPLAPMGAPFVFRPGPVLENPIRTAGDIDALRKFDPSSELGFVAAILKSVRKSLAGELPLLGFAGAPLTLAFFLIGGESPGANGAAAKALMSSDAALFHRLLDLLADMTVDYLRFQIESGADAVQLFESAADLVSPKEYAEFAHPYHVKILSKLEGLAPRILFAKDQLAVDLMAASGADVISVSARVDLADAKRRYSDRVAIQGNVDNRLLAEGSLEEIEAAVLTCLEAGGHEGHILNLGHGLLANTPEENVRKLIEVSRTVLPDARSTTSAAEA
ncbi:MAG: uroporphyrinogen decarboxylase [Phycisphaerales bacterium]|nr:MAG: uroporphyrinogen decarboxylase [Phycisphaerales bacterium]